MERSHIAVLLGFLVTFTAGTMNPFPAVALTNGGEGCDASSLAVGLNRYCSSTEAPPTAACCHVAGDVFRATMGGDPDCICNIHRDWAFIDIGITLEHLAHILGSSDLKPDDQVLADIYTDCGGPNPAGARLAVRACESRGTEPAELPLPPPSSDTPL
uniref:Bifunctional inhibitor/plant lipid transfer protein/seed storage helical domain-containing protein n=1 Tax=Leersia perrieri TaxID=77586 RepID=A0A0D9VX55_9ORYZ